MGGGMMENKEGAETKKRDGGVWWEVGVQNRAKIVGVDDFTGGGEGHTTRPAGL